MFKLSHPVGDVSKKNRSDWNQKADVKIVQGLLNEKLKSEKILSNRFNIPLEEDGIFGRHTQAAIEYFQVNKVKLAHYDAVIDPKGPTIKKLTESVAPNRLKEIWNGAAASAIAVDANHAKRIAQQANNANNVLACPAAGTLSGAGEHQKFTNAEFVAAVYQDAKVEESISGVPAAVTTAQAILETKYGQRVPRDIYTKKYSYNLFGIKAHGSPNYVSVYTHEEIGGKSVPMIDKFRAYSSFTESIKDRTDFFKRNKRYAVLFETKDPEEWAKLLQKKGYATDSLYPQKLINLMKQWNLK